MLKIWFRRWKKKNLFLLFPPYFCRQFRNNSLPSLDKWSNWPRYKINYRSSKTFTMTRYSHLCETGIKSLSLSLFSKGERISPRCIFIRLAGFHFREIQAWAYLIASFLFWDAEYRTTTYLTVLNIAVSRGCVRRESSEKKAGWSFQLEIRTVKLHVEIASGFVTLSLTMIYPSGENSICFIMIVRCICFQD